MGMRKLYVVPIIHSSADLGTLAAAIDKTGRDRLGEGFWQGHKAVVAGFWSSMANFFASLTVTGFQLYQDGLIANGEMGMKIVEHGVKEGSKNYEIIAQLLTKGARLVKTEDFSLLKREYGLISRIAQSKSKVGRIAASLRYRIAAKKLLRARDKFIAETISQTLREGQTGILFIGAYHDVIPLLPDDIDVKEVKETEKVREYQASLIDLRPNGRRLERLREYLISPVELDQKQSAS